MPVDALALSRTVTSGPPRRDLDSVLFQIFTGDLDAQLRLRMTVTGFLLIGDHRPLVPTLFFTCRVIVLNSVWLFPDAKISPACELLVHIQKESWE